MLLAGLPMPRLQTGRRGPLQSLSVVGEVLSTPISRARSEVITCGCRFRRSNKVDPAPPGRDAVKPSRSQPGPHEYLLLRVVGVGYGPAQVKQRADHMLCDVQATTARRKRSHVLPKHPARPDRIDPTPSCRPPASLLVTTPQGLSYLVQRPLPPRPTHAAPTRSPRLRNVDRQPHPEAEQSRSHRNLGNGIAWPGSPYAVPSPPAPGGHAPAAVESRAPPTSSACWLGRSNTRNPGNALVSPGPPTANAPPRT